MMERGTGHVVVYYPNHFFIICQEVHFWGDKK